MNSRGALESGDYAEAIMRCAECFDQLHSIGNVSVRQFLLLLPCFYWLRILQSMRMLLGEHLAFNWSHRILLVYPENGTSMG